VNTLPRLIATDLDGTLTRPDGSISERTSRALAAATTAGAVVVLVTGRPVRWLSRIYGYLTEPYVGVCANGAVSYDPSSDEILTACYIPAGGVRSAVDRIRADVPGTTFAAEVDGSRRMIHEAAYPYRYLAEDPDVSDATLDEIATVPAVKLLVRANGWDADALTGAVRSAVGPSLETTHSSPNGLVELSAAGVTKATGLAAYAQTLGLGPDDAIVFGDMPNDLPMFEWVAAGSPLRAVAVANAHPSVLAAAGNVTAANTDDGVADYLERLLS